MAEAKEKHEPVRQSVHVDCPIEDAFRIFTEEFAEWFPVGDDCTIEPWMGGRVFERTRSGEERDLGAVTLWNPPKRLEFTWHRESSVEVEFRVVADGTQVTLTHRGWESAGVEICALRHFHNYVAAQMLVAV